MPVLSERSRGRRGQGILTQRRQERGDAKGTSEVRGQGQGQGFRVQGSGGRYYFARTDPTTITAANRLELIRAKTRVDPRDLRRVSDHLSQIQKDVAAAKAEYQGRRR